MTGLKPLLTFGPWIACAILFLLWRAEVNDHRASLAQAETDKVLAINVAERTTREALSEAHQRELDQKESLLVQAQGEREALSEAVLELESQVSGQGQVITQLELEADIEEIPTYEDCSIVNVPSRLLFAEDCRASGAGGDYDYRVCVGPEGLHPLDPAFTHLTVADLQRAHAADRLALGQCNAQLAAIAALGVVNDGNSGRP